MKRTPKSPDTAAPAIKRSAVLWIAALAIAAGAIAGLSIGWTPSKGPTSGPEIVVYRDPPCRCCVKWIKYLRSHGFDVQERVENDLAAVRKLHGVPEALKSCHTALIDRGLRDRRTRIGRGHHAPSGRATASSGPRGARHARCFARNGALQH